MTERVVFEDLVGPVTSLDAEDDPWLMRLGQFTAPEDHVVHVGRSFSADDHESVLHRDLYLGWRAGRYVGELRFENRVLEIRPRLGITVLAEWAAAALNLRVVPRTGEHAGAAPLIAELMAASWRSALVEAARHGLPGFREDRRTVDAYVRGRLDVPATLRLRAAGRPLVASIERPKILDNAMARCIVLADRALSRLIPRADWRGERVEEIVDRLRAVTGPRPRLPTRRELRGVRFTPITLPYRHAGWLSWEIARGRGIRSRATGERVEGLLLDVAELWELFVVHCAGRALGQTSVTHGTRLAGGRHLLHSANGNRGLGRLFPDLVIGPPDQPRAVVDAKYKPLSAPRGVDREDLYQLTSYLTSYDTTPLGMLAYPDLPDDPLPAWEQQHGPWRTRHGHKVRFERLPLHEPACTQRLIDLLASRAVTLATAGPMHLSTET